MEQDMTVGNEKDMAVLQERERVDGFCIRLNGRAALEARGVTQNLACNIRFGTEQNKENPSPSYMSRNFHGDIIQ
jgi:hypothetical protein